MSKKFNIRHHIIVNMRLELLRFLIARNILNSYVTNCISMWNNKPQMSRDLYLLIQDFNTPTEAFYWDKTPETRYFWSRMYDKFVQTKTHLGLRHYIICNMSYKLLSLLIQSKLLEVYIDNCVEHYTSVSSITKEQYINHGMFNTIVKAFTWSKTPQKVAFWQKVNRYAVQHNIESYSFELINIK